MIPTYNPREDYLRATLESVLSQVPEGSAQIEVVDDRSPGIDVGSVVKNICGDRVSVFQNSVNLGLAGCWNACISRARGEFVHILHQDDFVLPGFYEALEAGFNNSGSTGAAFCRPVFVDEDSHWLSLSQLEARTAGILPDFTQRISGRNIVQCASIAVRKSVYDKLGVFSSEFPHTLDWEMWVRIGKNFGVHYEPRPLACYRLHSSSMTSRQVRSGEQAADIFHALNAFSDNLGKAEAASARRYYADYTLQFVRQLANDGNARAAIKNLRIILRNCRALPVWMTGSKLLLKLLAGPLKRNRRSALATAERAECNLLQNN